MTKKLDKTWRGLLSLHPTQKTKIKASDWIVLTKLELCLIRTVSYASVSFTDDHVLLKGADKQVCLLVLLLFVRTRPPDMLIYTLVLWPERRAAYDQTVHLSRAGSVWPEAVFISAEHLRTGRLLLDSPSQHSNHPDVLFQSRNVFTVFKFTSGSNLWLLAPVRAIIHLWDVRI